MLGRTALALAASAVAAFVTAAPAHAKILHYHVLLNGKSGPEPTGSLATGRANVSVDTVTHAVSVDLDVRGIMIGDLWQKLVAAPIGPIHFHQYATAMSSSSMLALPLPFGPAYQPTSTGLHVRMDKFDYAADAALVKSTLSFDDFVAAMNKGLIVLNVHTDQFNPGEISGVVTPD